MGQKIELLAPAGNWSMLTAAIDAGADAVYFGIADFNMRAAAQNFSVEEISKVISYCHEHKVKAYCTVNVIIFEPELEALDKILVALKHADVDAVICWDLAVIKKCRELGIPIHLSTQASVSNSSSADLWKTLGVTRVVLARECSLQDIADIRKKTGLEIEVFIHGARCISLSGRCFMSYELFNKSANRGECLQPCRREYTVTDEDGKKMALENNFVLSAKDLCTLPILPELAALGVHCLKIEGRNRGPDYVSKIIIAYKTALQAIEKKEWDEEFCQRLMKEVESVYNKGFSKGFLADYPHHDRSDVYGSKATVEKAIIGKVSNFYSQKNVAEIKVESSSFRTGDVIAFTGPTTGYFEENVSEIKSDDGCCDLAEKGAVVTVKVSGKVRENDAVYLLKKRKNI